MESVTFITGLESIIAATFLEIPEIAMAIDGRTRARLAVFCFSRGHLREKGLSIASVCRWSDLVAESSSHVAENLHTHAHRFPLHQQPRNYVSLAGV